MSEQKGLTPSTRVADEMAKGPTRDPVRPGPTALGDWVTEQQQEGQRAQGGGEGPKEPVATS